MAKFLVIQSVPQHPQYPHPAADQMFCQEPASQPSRLRARIQMYKMRPSFRLTRRKLIHMMYGSNLICNIALICIASLGYAVSHYAKTGANLATIIKHSLHVLIEMTILGGIFAAVASYIYSFSVGTIMFKARNTSRQLFLMASVGWSIITSALFYTLLQSAGMYEGIINQWLIYMPWLIFTASSCWSIIRLRHINQSHSQEYLN